MPRHGIPEFTLGKQLLYDTHYRAAHKHDFKQVELLDGALAVKLLDGLANAFHHDLLDPGAIIASFLVSATERAWSPFNKASTSECIAKSLMLDPLCRTRFGVLVAGYHMKVLVMNSFLKKSRNYNGHLNLLQGFASAAQGYSVQTGYCRNVVWLICIPLSKLQSE